MKKPKHYKYLIAFVIDVKRTDGAMLTDNENAMVQEMKVATEQAIAKIAVKYGNNNSEHLGSKTRIY